MEALVYKSTGSWYIVKTADGTTYKARIKGIFKIDGITSTNPIAVGDWVTIVPETGETDTVVITEIAERKNYVARVSPHNRHSHHIVASNLDQSLLFITLRDPKTSMGFVDRFLVACEMYKVPAILVFNKVDVYKKKELEKLEEVIPVYEQLGYQVLCCSLQTLQGVAELQEVLANKTTLLSGHSGVGKSTFINHLFPDLRLRTQEVSGWSGKGLHTTTFAEMFDLPQGGTIIDTPGIREMGLVDVTKQELSGYFPEMKRLVNDCQFNNCLHVNEPDCAVKDAVNEGTIAIDRYVSYLNIMDTVGKKEWE